MLTQFKSQLHQLGRPFTLILASEMATLAALLVGNLTLSWWIVKQGGASDLAVFGVAIAAASLVAIPLLSPLADRYPKKNLMAISFVAIASESVVLALLAQSDHYNLFAVIACEMIDVMAMAMISPCIQTIASELVPANQLSLAIRMQKVSGSVGGILGPALAGGVLATGGVVWSLWMHVALLLAAAFFAARLPKIATTATSNSWNIRKWGHELRAGLSVKWRLPLERNWTLVTMCIGTVYAPAIGMLVALRVTTLGLSAAWLGATNMGIMLGMLLGFLGGASLFSNRVGRFPTLLAAFFLRASMLVVVGVTSSPVLLVAAFLALGLSQSAIQFVGVTHRQLAMPVDFRARSASANILAWQVSSTLGPAIAGMALMRFSVAQCYVAFGLVIACCTIGMTLVPRIRHFLSLDHDAVTDWYGREYPYLFQRMK